MLPTESFKFKGFAEGESQKLATYGFPAKLDCPLEIDGQPLV